MSKNNNIFYSIFFSQKRPLKKPIFSRENFMRFSPIFHPIFGVIFGPDFPQLFPPLFPHFSPTFSPTFPRKMTENFSEIS